MEGGGERDKEEKPEREADEQNMEEAGERGGEKGDAPQLTEALNEIRV